MDMESILCDIEELNCRLICKLKCEFEKGLDCVDAAEAGEVTDMIKDLAETKRNLCEAIYYETVTEAMEEAGHDHYGYNPNRYASGRYAPAGRGRKGYVPYIDMYLDNPNEMIRMGYHGKHEEMTIRDPHTEWDERYGKAYNEYKNSKRYYTETKSLNDKHEMESHATEHIMDTIATVKEIYKSSDPELRKKIKDDINRLASEMTT